MQDLVNLMQVISAPAYFFDTESHRLLAVNHGFVDMMQYSEEQLLRMKVEDLRPEEDLGALHKALASSPPQGIVEWKYLRRSGEVIFVRLSYRNSTYFDKDSGTRHDVRLVVVSSWDTECIRSANEVFG